MEFPILYKKTSTGADQMWHIRTAGNVIKVRFGQVGGAIQETADIIRSGKNIGRSNETTPEQQADAEAKSQWEKKLKKGYVQNLQDAQSGKVDSIIEGGFFPMLAHKYSERGDDITFPAYIQPKLDGHRCLAVIENGKATLWSRTRKRITSMPHIVDWLEKVFGKFEGKIELDGELYNHTYHDEFEMLTHFIRSETPEPGYEILRYNVYDVNMPGEFQQRKHWLESVFRYDDGAPVELVETFLIRSEEEMMESFEEFNKNGYEGLMVRNVRGPYVGKRSVDLQKVKTFIDEEFRIIEVTEGRGKLAGHALFVCELPNRETFAVKMKGELETLKSYFENPQKVIGRELTVKFQGYTKYGKPRFPVGWRIAEKL